MFDLSLIEIAVRLIALMIIVVIIFAPMAVFRRNLQDRAISAALALTAAGIAIGLLGLSDPPIQTEIWAELKKLLT